MSCFTRLAALERKIKPHKQMPLEIVEEVERVVRESIEDYEADTRLNYLTDKKEIIQALEKIVYSND